MRRWLLVLASLSSMGLSACGDANQAGESTTTLSVESTTTTPSVVPTTTVSDTAQPETSSTTIGTATTVGAPVPESTTPVAPTTTVLTTARARPRLSLSQAEGLDPTGTLITVRGSGFDESKGVYLFVCNQAAWTAARRCIGGVNVDGSSPLSQWVSSNPPGYARGLTIPYEAGGSFVVPLLVRATDSATNFIDCTTVQCGVVAFADHTRRDDRSQDVFVPITFASGSSS